MYIYVYIYIDICVCVCVVIHILVYMHACIYIYIYTHIFLYIYICVYVYIYITRLEKRHKTRLKNKKNQRRLQIQPRETMLPLNWDNEHICRFLTKIVDFQGELSISKIRGSLMWWGSIWGVCGLIFLFYFLIWWDSPEASL